MRHGEGGVDVGGRHHAPVVQAEPAGDDARQVERQQVHGVHQEHPQEDRERERREEAAVEVEDFLDRACRRTRRPSRRTPGHLPGTPEVALRAASQNRPSASTPISTDMKMVSTWKVQNPSPTLRWVRWWVMYSVLFAGPAAAACSAADIVSYPLRTSVSSAARARGLPQASSRRRSPRTPPAAAAASTFFDRNATTSKARVKDTFTTQPMKKLQATRCAVRALAVPQHRERHQRRRSDADPGPEQRGCASAGPPHGEAGDRNDRPEQRLSEHDRQCLAPALLDLRVAQGLTQSSGQQKSHVMCRALPAHGWRLVTVPGLAMLQCTRLRKAQNYRWFFCTASMQCTGGFVAVATDPAGVAHCTFAGSWPLSRHRWRRLFISNF